ncbi:head protein [Myxococcus sp. CA039A]|uniref:head protein n=1 Tax=Myxococcus sp. CA039A TaxID=2741737 RepID=UPI0020C74150|nr:head protein [Myxococcus sp. CA039A]
MAMDALAFITQSGQAYVFADYIRGMEEHAPPLVIASFKTRSEAKRWLDAHPEPPDGAHLLIAGEYHRVVYFQEKGFRHFLPSPVLEFYLQDIEEEGLPPPVATFDTVEQAQAWVDSQPEPPRQVLILINGAPHLVAYHYRVNVRAIYPMSLAAKAAPAPADEPAD